jgi:hypothetical protein
MPNPGPWMVRKTREQYHNDDFLVKVIDANGDTVADNQAYYPEALNPDNADLIAASPELLDALVSLVAEVGDVISEESPEDLQAAFAYARLIISKAKGEV